MRRPAVRWGIIGALVTEFPIVIAILFIHMDVNVKVLLAVTIWKFGAAFGAWLGAMAASEQGLEAEDAARYEKLLREGRWLLSVNAGTDDRRFARGAMLESDAIEVRDVHGTFDLKSMGPAHHAGVNG